MRPSPGGLAGWPSAAGGVRADATGGRRRPAQAPVPHATALSADAELLAAEPSALGGRIHSVFASVVNIATPDGGLWCLTAQSVAPGPRAVRIDRDSFGGVALVPHMPVSVSDAVRIADVLTVRMDGAEAWAPQAIHGRVDGDRIRELERALALVGVAGGAQAGDDPFSRAVAERIGEGLDAIATGIRRGDEDAVTHAAGGLVGLGTGLTPAGDDVLTGLAYASAQLGGPLSIVPPAVGRAAASGATHAIALTAMREACRGRAVEPLGDLLAALCTRDDARGTARDAGDTAGDGRRAASIPRLTAVLTGIGHTSGTDQAHGLLAAVRLLQEMRGK